MALIIETYDKKSDGEFLFGINLMFIEDWSMDDSFCHHFPGQPRTTATQADC